MAERETERKAPVHRSVSFKKLESCRAKRRSFGEDLDRCGALPPDAVEHSAQPSQATHAVTVSRKVSEISASSLSTADLKKASHGISPSVRQLSEKFSLSTGGTQSSLVNTGSVKNTKSVEDSSLSESGCLSKEFSESATEKQLKDSNRYCSAQESVSGSDSDRGDKHRLRKTVCGPNTGKIHCFEITSPHLAPNKSAVNKDTFYNVSAQAYVLI